MTDARWTVSDHDTYAVLHRADGTAAARFHVIAEAHAAARAMDSSREAVEAARREEREACAALCERDAALLRQDLDFDTARGVAHAAAAIRARSGGKEG